MQNTRQCILSGSLSDQDMTGCYEKRAMNFIQKIYLCLDPGPQQLPYSYSLTELHLVKK